MSYAHNIDTAIETLKYINSDTIIDNDHYKFSGIGLVHKTLLTENDITTIKNDTFVKRAFYIGTVNDGFAVRLIFNSQKHIICFRKNSFNYIMLKNLILILSKFDNILHDNLFSYDILSYATPTIFNDKILLEIDNANDPNNKISIISSVKKIQHIDNDVLDYLKV